VHDGRPFQRVPGTLAPEQAARGLPQVLVHQGQGANGGLPAAVAPELEQIRKRFAARDFHGEWKGDAWSRRRAPALPVTRTAGESRIPE
jgi:hypothetical protein